jgi:uncharacterized membrane protein YciS (DUF1049 family)
MQTVRRLLALALFVGLFVVAWRFASANASEIEIDLLLLQLPAVPIWVALLSALGFGALSAVLFLGYQVIKKNLLARRYRKTVKSLESEIHQLRNLPLAGTDSALASSADAEAQDGEIQSRSA